MIMDVITGICILVIVLCAVWVFRMSLISAIGNMQKASKLTRPSAEEVVRSYYKPFSVTDYYDRMIKTLADINREIAANRLNLRLDSPIELVLYPIPPEPPKEDENCMVVKEDDLVYPIFREEFDELYGARANLQSQLINTLHWEEIAKCTCSANLNHSLAQTANSIRCDMQALYNNHRS